MLEREVGMLFNDPLEIGNNEGDTLMAWKWVPRGTVDLISNRSSGALPAT